MPRIPAAQRRNDLILAAVEVMAARGIDGATTRRIADEAGANLAMLHYCYDSKEALFGDVYRYLGTKYRQVIEGCEAHGTVQATVDEVLRAIMRFYVDSPSFAIAAFELMTWARRQDEVQGIAVYEEATEALRERLRAVDTENPLPEDLVDQIAYLVGTLADGFAVNCIAYGNRELAQHQTEVVVSVMQTWLAAQLTPAAAGR